MRKDKSQCDFSIKAGSEEIFAHRNILSAGSDYFKAMLSHDTKESQAGFVEIKKASPICVEKCIDFIYTGTGSVADGDRQDLMYVAHMMQLQRLCDGIAVFLENDLSPETFVSTKQIAKMFNCKKLENHCNQFSLENFRLIAVSEDFKDLEKDDVSFLVTSKEAKATVDDKCKALILWAQYESTERALVFEENFKLLDLSKMQNEYMRYLLENEPLVCDSKPCWKILFAALMDKAKIKSEDHIINGECEMLEFSSCYKPKNHVVAVFDKTSKSIQGLNLENNQWVKLQSITDEIASKQFVAVVIDEDIYILGYDKTNYCLKNYSDPEATWVRVSDRKSNGRLRAVTLNGIIYAFDDSDDYSSAVESLRAPNETWRQVTKKPVSSYECSLVSAKGSIYCLGGYKNAYSISNNLKFDPVNSKWHTLPNLPAGRCYAAAVELDEKIYVLGGSPFNDYLNTTSCFDIASETWTNLACMHHARMQLGACVAQNKIYIIGGLGSNDNIEEYDPVQNTWKVIGNTTEKNIEAEASLSLVHMV
uniref:kelch-like protein 12 n=1 Tax=Styela clava TaxID=7725 RepID=UPI00193AC348|nr:kelch-like protein 12 [Styela clava]